MQRTRMAVFTVACFCVGTMLAADLSRAGGPDDHVKESVQHAKDALKHAEEALAHAEHGLDTPAPTKK